MIIDLLDLADRLSLTGKEAFNTRPIHWIIDLDELGNFLVISPTISKAKKTKSSDWDEELGKNYSYPSVFFMSENKQRKIKATAGGGQPVTELGVGNLLAIYGVKVESKRGEDFNIIKATERKEKIRKDNFINLLRELTRERPNNVIAQAVLSFLESNQEFPVNIIAKRHIKSINEQDFSFRVNGRLMINDAEIKEWWENKFNCKRSEILKNLKQGQDNFPLFYQDDCKGYLTPVFPPVFGIPGSGPYCPIASFDKPPYQSYGMGDMTAPIRLEVAEKATAALNWLLKDDTTHLRMGDTVVIFWAMPENSSGKGIVPLNFGDLLSEADPLQVREFVEGVWAGILKPLEQDRFFAAILSSPQSRITVRSWHTETLPNAIINLQKWFKSLFLPNIYGEELPLSIPDLAKCTIRKDKKSKPLPNTYLAIFESAFFGQPMPIKLFTSALIRQSMELAKGYDKKTRKDFEDRLRARSALIKLYFNLTKGEDMTQEKHNIERNAGYLCGRLLAILDKIHYEAHKESGGTKSSPANRVYGAASKTPALIFPQLCNLTRHHLNKIGGGWAYCLEYGYPEQNFESLAGICAKLKETVGKEFPRTLSLYDQGRFAIGFYYERCRRWPKKEEDNKESENN